MLKSGDKFTIGGPRPSDANTVGGSGWEAVRTADGFELGFIRAAHGGGEERFAITDDEFVALREDPDQFRTIVARRQG